jgi:hypothetical protein
VPEFPIGNKATLDHSGSPAARSRSGYYSPVLLCSRVDFVRRGSPTSDTLVSLFAF